MAPLIIPIAATLLGVAMPPSCEAPFGARARDRAAPPSLSGLPGLLEVPAAVSAPDRSYAFAFNSIRTGSTPDQTQQRNGFVSFGFLPRLTLIARGSVMDNFFNAGMRDISATAQMLLAREKGWRPSVAIGAQDIGGAAPNFETRYAVASKTFAGRARLTAGFGSGLGKTAYSLDGPFGGVEIAPCSWLTLLAENESRRRNFGVRLAPLGDWGVRTGIEPTIDLAWREGQGRMAGVGLRIQTSAPYAPRERTAPPTATRLAASPAGAAGLVDALARHGLENLRVGRLGDTVAVRYENRVHNREEWDALGVVMGEVARHAAGASVMRITILRLDLPVMQVTSGIPVFSAFLAGTADGPTFGRQLVVTHPSEAPAESATNPSRFRLDITARPRIEALMLTEISVLEQRLSLLPEATLTLGRGLSITGRRALILQKSVKFPDEYANPNADQILLHATRIGVPFAPAIGNAITQVSVGRFGAREVGVAAEFDVLRGDGRLSLGGTAAVFGEDPAHLRRSVALGSVRRRDAERDITWSLTAGRFFHGDVGAAGEVERRFGLGEVAFYFQKTDLAAIAGARVAFPLTFARDLRPGPVRVRLPDYGEVSNWTQVLNERNTIRTDVARPLPTTQGVSRVFRGRDRLNGDRLVRDVEALRQAAVRWVGK